MLFNQLKNGDEIYILEVVGTFKKTTEYYVGRVSQISQPYDEPVPPGQFQMPNQQRKRVIDITVSCNGESKKFTVSDNKSIINDATLGLTITTDKSELVRTIKDQYDIYRSRKEQLAKCDEEMSKCQAILDKIDIPSIQKEDPRIKELQNEVDELKKVIKQASAMVPPAMMQQLPQNMQNIMNKVD